MPMLILNDVSMPFEYAIGRLELPIPSIYGIIAAKQGRSFYLYSMVAHLTILDYEAFL